MAGTDTELLPVEIEQKGKEEIWTKRILIKMEKKYWSKLEKAMETLRYNNRLARPRFWEDLLKYIVEKGILDKFVEEQLKKLLEKWKEEQQ